MIVSKRIDYRTVPCLKREVVFKIFCLYSIPFLRSLSIRNVLHLDTKESKFQITTVLNQLKYKSRVEYTLGFEIVDVC